MSRRAGPLETTKGARPLDWSNLLRLAHENAFYNIALVLFLSAAAGAVGIKLRQPLIVAFLAVGIVVGPSGLKILEHGQIELLAQIGISLLLFVVGLRLDLHMIRVMGPVALATGLGQVLFTSIFGFLIALGLGMNVVTSAYVSVALTFSSTIIIVKLLSDKKEIDALHGRIAVGFLIVQDIVAILAMIGLTALGGGLANEEVALGQVAMITLKGIGFLAFVGLLMRYVLPGFLNRLAHSHELLALFSIAWAVFLGAVGDALGFSKEVGAFLGGVSLASTGYREAIGARLVGVRDFLLLFFFIDLGARLELSALGGGVSLAFVFSLFVLIGNPLVVMAIMGAMGYRRRTGFMAGLTVAQISEFSLILAALGVRLGHIGPEALGVVTLVGVVTICASTYMIIYSGQIYSVVGPWLKVFERENPYREAEVAVAQAGPQVDVILLGMGNYGSKLAEELLERRKRVVGVDFDPQALDRAKRMGMEALYGDAGDPELLEQLPINRSSWVVSTVRDRQLSLALLRILRQRGYDGKVALTARDEQEARDYQQVGAHVALRPFSDAAEQAADTLSEAMELLPDGVDWPVALVEARVRHGSRYGGVAIREIPLRAETGVSILAVSRAGHAHFDLGPDFHVLPGDKVALIGDPENVRRAQDMLNEREHEADGGARQFSMAETPLRERSALVGRTLAELRFQQDHGVMVVGIRRGEQRMPFPRSNERLEDGDRLIVVGERKAVERLKREAAL